MYSLFCDGPNQADKGYLVVSAGGLFFYCLPEENQPVYTFGVY